MAVPAWESNTGVDSSDAAFNGNGGATVAGSAGKPRKPVHRGKPTNPQAAANDEIADPSREPTVEEHVLSLTGMDVSGILNRVREAESRGQMFFQTYVKARWERNYRAFRNEHFEGSKYRDERWAQRSKLFRPKTSNAVRKNLAAAGQALFGNADVVTISSADEGDPLKTASAAIKQELINIRLTRTANRNGIPWFLTAMGSNQDAQITGITCSKQFWRYEEEEVDEDEANVPLGLGPLFRDPDDGRVYQVTMDRPEVLNIPPENVLWDFNCDWRNAAQTSNWLIVRYPMQVHDVRRMMTARPNQSSPDWFDVPEAELTSLAASAPVDALAIRMAREGGANREGNQQTGAYRVIWVYECFLRHEGKDWNFWTLGTNRLLSMPARTRKAYPAYSGERPYVIGMGAIEAHRSTPMSPVERLQPLQQEINDFANAMLDQQKQVVTPLAKVLRGRQVDIDQVQRRSPDGVLMVTAQDDVTWDKPTGLDAGAFSVMNGLNSDFDTQAGSFDGASVAGNRQLNETVGGMKLLNGSASAVTEYDLRVWVETWVEPVINQVIKLEEFYESDEQLLIVAGQKAQLMQRFGVDTITDRMLQTETNLTVAVGLGAGNPMEALGKFAQAADVASKIIAPFIQAGLVNIRPKTGAIVDEVFGKAGFKDAGERFFVIDDQNPPPAMQPQQQDPKAALDAQKLQQDGQLKQLEIQAKAQTAMAQIQDRREERQTNTSIARLKVMSEMAKARLSAVHAERLTHLDHSHDHAMAQADRIDRHIGGHIDRTHAAEQSQMSRVAEMARERRGQQGKREDAEAAFQRSRGAAVEDRDFNATREDAAREEAAAAAAEQGMDA